MEAANRSQKTLSEASRIKQNKKKKSRVSKNSKQKFEERNRSVEDGMINEE